MSDADRLFRTYFHPLVRYLARQSGDWDIAEELAQQTLLRALRHLAEQPQPVREQSWVFTIATNLLRDKMRQDARHHRGLELLAREQRAIAADAVHDADLTGSDFSIAEQALRALGERDRSALLMSEEGLSYNDIAVALGISVQSVGTTLTRARRRLAERYESLCRKTTATGETNVKR